MNTKSLFDKNLPKIEELSAKLIISKVPKTGNKVQKLGKGVVSLKVIIEKIINIRPKILNKFLISFVLMSIKFLVT